MSTICLSLRLPTSPMYETLRLSLALATWMKPEKTGYVEASATVGAAMDTLTVCFSPGATVMLVSGSETVAYSVVRGKGPGAAKIVP